MPATVPYAKAGVLEKYDSTAQRQMIALHNAAGEKIGRRVITGTSATIKITKLTTAPKWNNRNVR